MKQKHNKKRNTAFIYESLIKEATKSIVSGNKEQKLKTIKIIKKYFGPDTVLRRELDLYRSLYENCDLNKNVCEKILREAKLQRRFLNSGEIFKLQTKLINEINKQLSPKLYNNFIPNYKTLASITQIFSGKLNPKSSVILENEIIEYMSKDSINENKDLKPIDNLVLNSFVVKFNEKYADQLLSEQKELLNYYISSFSDNGLELKMFLNEEIGRLKKKLKNSLQTKELIDDQQMSEKVNKILTKIDSYSQTQIDSKMLKQILGIQGLIREIYE